MAYIDKPSVCFALKIVSVLFIGFLTVSTANANTISGTVSLPSGMVAPAGGLDISVRGFPIGDFFLGSDRVTIAAGQSNANYFLEFLDNEDRRIEFNCDDCASIDVSSNGFWDNTAGIVGFFGATQFSGSQNHIVNILLESADTFRGTVSLPAGLRAQGDEFISVSINDTGFLSLNSFSDGEFLSEGQTSFGFAIGAPTNATNSGWDIRFSCSGCEERIEAEFHYATSLSGSNAALDSDLAFTFANNRDHSGIRLTLIDNQAPEDEEPADEDGASQILVPLFLLLDEE